MPPTSASSVESERRLRTFFGRALAARGEVRDEGLHGGVVALDHDRAGDQRLDHRQPRQVRFGGEEAEHRADPGASRVGPVVLGLEGIVDPLAQLLGDRVESRDEALVLAVEVLVEGAPRDRRVAGDVGDRGAAVAFFGDRLGEAGDQSLTLVVDDEVAGQSMPSGREAGELRRVLGRLDRVPRRGRYLSGSEVGGGPLRRLGTDVRRQGEVDEVGEERLDLLGLPLDDALVDDPEDAADDRFLECVGEVVAEGRFLAAGLAAAG